MAGVKRRDWMAWPAAAAFAGWAGAAWAQGDADAHAWLEAVEGPQALDWVAQQNAQALALIEKHPSFAKRRDDMLASLSTGTNVPMVSRSGEYLYNFFRSPRRPHGVWRRTTLEEYAKPEPRWQVLLYVDDLAREAGRDLVFSHFLVHAPSERALVFFSAGGEDRVEMREFDLANRGFVTGGFHAPTAKMWVQWFGPDELLIATEAGPGSVTASGYPAALRRWKRGTDVLAAPEVLRGEPGDMQVNAQPGRRDGLPPLALVQRRLTFFRWERHLLHADGTRVRLDVPADAFAWIDQEWLVLSLRSAWTVGGQSLAEGSVVAIELAEATSPQRRVHVLLQGQERRRAIRTEKVRDGFVVAYSDDLRPALVFQRWTGARFEATALPAPADGMLMIAADRPARDNRFWMNTQGPITPFVVRLVDAAAPAEPVVSKPQPPMFDAHGLAVRQFNARSADGTQVPYTVIGARDPKPGTPTLLYGYGGFGTTLELDYQRWPGIHWLQYGGTYVMAHIRGGGEFGPAWYHAAKGVARQKSFDDFIAVAEDLVARGITRPAHLGIYGASNGGALVSAVLVQRPELFGAAVARVPLTDMLGYTRLLAGPSWVEEYGDPGKPSDRAVLARWSPYHNIKKAAPGASYPPTLFIGNRNDDRVHPAHARKMAAQLQAQGHTRTWLYEEIRGGHSGVTDPRIHAQREALLYTFLWMQLSQER